MQHGVVRVGMVLWGGRSRGDGQSRFTRLRRYIRIWVGLRIDDVSLGRLV
jgi:hypothetical protein